MYGSLYELMEGYVLKKYDENQYGIEIIEETPLLHLILIYDSKDDIIDSFLAYRRSIAQEWEVIDTPAGKDTVALYVSFISQLGVALIEFDRKQEDVFSFDRAFHTSEE